MVNASLDRALLPELFQTEWCPSSRRVRQRLMELGISYVCRQVAAERDDREALVRETGVDSVPVLMPPHGPALVGETAIVTYLDEHYEEPAGAEAHRLKAIKARQRELEEATT